MAREPAAADSPQRTRSTDGERVRGPARAGGDGANGAFSLPTCRARRAWRRIDQSVAFSTTATSPRSPEPAPAIPAGSLALFRRITLGPSPEPLPAAGLPRTRVRYTTRGILAGSQATQLRPRVRGQHSAHPERRPRDQQLEPRRSRRTVLPQRATVGLMSHRPAPDQHSRAAEQLIAHSSLTQDARHHRNQTAFGSVDRSLPNAAVSDVNRSPASCMPSPESPANRMTTRSLLTGSCSPEAASRAAAIVMDVVRLPARCSTSLVCFQR
jgi:hypothetical protein